MVAVSTAGLRTFTGPDVRSVAVWINQHAELAIDPHTATLDRLAGGNSNVTHLLTSGDRKWVVRRPPLHELDASAHSMAREWTVLTALAGTAVAINAPIAHCTDTSVLGAEFLVVEHLADSVSLTSELPVAYGHVPDAVSRLGFALVDALSAIQAVDWAGVGLREFGRPEGFLGRQVPRWEKQYRRNEVRDLPVFDTVSRWLTQHLPAEQPPALLHGDFHLDNCLFAADQPRLLAVIDWEMATIGDPLLDLGLMLAMWGPRLVDPPGMPLIQGVSRAAGSPTRSELTERYALATGRDLSDVLWYQVLALWKLAGIVEGAWAQHVRGELRSPYTAALERDVPLLLEEAAELTAQTT
jgi:aminoglycoside phosphotransferase (APT) family kinase protein